MVGSGIGGSWLKIHRWPEGPSRGRVTPSHPPNPQQSLLLIQLSRRHRGYPGKTAPRHDTQRGKLGQDSQLLEAGNSREWERAVLQLPGCLVSPSSVPRPRQCPWPPPAPHLPSAELGLPSSVCSFSSFSRFSEAHAPDSSCCRMVGQNSLNSLCPTGEPSLRLWMAKSSTELKHWGREGTGTCLEIPTAQQGDFGDPQGGFGGPLLTRERFRRC